MKNKETNDQHWKVLVLILRKIAVKKGITHQEIADKTGLKRSNVSRMFNVQYCPNLRTFIAVAMSINVNFFFEDKDGDTELNEVFESAMNELGRRPDQMPKN